MKRPLAGKKAFYAMGQRAKTSGYPFIVPKMGRNWPLWAKSAWACGWLNTKVAA